VTVLVTEDPTFGRILVDAKAHPLYWDRHVPAGRLPPCDTACARAWAPILVPAGHSVSGGTALPTLGTIARSDGSRQVTLDGYPLFRYLPDPASGAVTGNGAMTGWQVATAR
jgi:predicted lipoprotein with Yx(FWY)xxD motif